MSTEERYEHREEDLAKRFSVLHSTYGDEVAPIAVAHILGAYRQEIVAEVSSQHTDDSRKVFIISMLLQAVSFMVGFSVSHWVLPWLHGG